MSTLTLTCGACHTRYDVSGRRPGQQVRCARCQALLRVPEESARRDSGRLDSARLRLMRGPACQEHPRAVGEARCSDCAAWACTECLAAPPLDHLCARCAKRRGLGGALPVDFGLAATPALAAQALAGRALLSCAVWNLLGMLFAFTLYALPVALGAYAFLQIQETAPGSTAWSELAAAVTLAGLLGAFLTYHGLLVPAGCGVLLEGALRRRQASFQEGLSLAARRVARNAGALFGVVLLVLLLFACYLVLVLAVTYGVEQAASGDPLRLSDAIALRLPTLAVLVGGAALGFGIAATGLGLSVLVVVFEERGPLQAVSRAWELANRRLGDLIALVAGFACVYGALTLVMHGLAKTFGAPVLPVLLFLDTLWPALLTAAYLGLAAEDAGVPGRH